jgi:hypothetical protein
MIKNNKKISSIKNIRKAGPFIGGKRNKFKNGFCRAALF